MTAKARSGIKKAREKNLVLMSSSSGNPQKVSPSDFALGSSSIHSYLLIGMRNMKATQKKAYADASAIPIYFIVRIYPEALERGRGAPTSCAHIRKTAYLGCQEGVLWNL
jgi:hypothetical protein